MFFFLLFLWPSPCTRYDETTAAAAEAAAAVGEEKQSDIDRITRRLDMVR
jgi:hypothetical protein